MSPPPATFGQRCARALFDARREAADKGKPFLLGDASRFIDQFYKAEKPKAAPRTGITGSGMTEEQWLKMLEESPAYAGIDVRRELGKCQMWAGEAGKKVSRRRFINWLNKAEVPIGTNGAGQSSQRKLSPRGPAGWLATLNRLFAGSTLAAGGIHEIKVENDYQWSLLDESIRKQISAAMP